MICLTYGVHEACTNNGVLASYLGPFDHEGLNYLINDKMSAIGWHAEPLRGKYEHENSADFEVE